MSDGPKNQAALFLERRSYRRRRLVDAVRFVPILGVVLFVMPVLWAGEGKTSAGLIYLFTAWAVLILAMAVLARAITRGGPAEPDMAHDVGNGPADETG